MHDWLAQPVREILPLIPAIRNNAEGVDPPPHSWFVLRLDASNYFIRFRILHAGIVFSPNVDRACRCENLIEAATYAVFIKERLPANNQSKLFVEMVRKQKNNGASLAKPQEKPKARAAGV